MENKTKKKIMIGTPSYDGKLEAWYVNSLIETIKMSYEKDVDIITGWVSYDALIQRARNDTVAIALENDVDALFFIDADIEWKPEWFFKILEHKEDVVGGTYVKKTDENQIFPIYNTNQNWQIQENNLIEVTGLGTGFLKFSRNALKCLWDNSPEYYEYEKNNQAKRLIFNVGVTEDKQLVSEDMWACLILGKHGFKIWLDPTITCNHIGTKKFSGNFANFIESLKTDNKLPTNVQNVDDDTII